MRPQRRVSGAAPCSMAAERRSSRALWLGTPLALDRSMLEAVDTSLLASGRSEESTIDGTRKH